MAEALSTPRVSPRAGLTVIWAGSTVLERWRPALPAARAGAGAVCPRRASALTAAMAIIQDPSGRHRRLAAEPDARLAGDRQGERVRLGRAQLARRREGQALLSEGVWLGRGEERDGRGHGIHRVPSQWREHRGRHGDELDGSGPGAELLARVLHSGR